MTPNNSHFLPLENFDGNDSKVEVVREEEDPKTQINLTKLWSEWKTYQFSWENFGKDFGLALFFLIWSSYDLVSDTLVTNSFFSGNDYIRDVKNISFYENCTVIGKNIYIGKSLFLVQYVTTRWQ